MVSKRLKAKVRQGGTLALDAQGFSLHIDYDERLKALVELAERDGARVVLSALTPLEVQRSGRAAQRREFLLSRFDVVPVGDRIVETAGALLRESGLDGHECLVDAVVVATAASGLAPVRLVTSDRSHIPLLCKAAEKLPGEPSVKLIVV
ncbi:hypothetical protein GCM10010440_22080 [Kitasatospora cinereorecta]|uniref:PIN domain-containing protein n=1 Tax=Kitasatospora paracochleata TaxID=58354 RepID=UPI0031D29097